jgi:hypothetical protein
MPTGTRLLRSYCLNVNILQWSSSGEFFVINKFIQSHTIARQAYVLHEPAAVFQGVSKHVDVVINNLVGVIRIYPNY